MRQKKAITIAKLIVAKAVKSNVHKYTDRSLAMSEQQQLNICVITCCSLHWAHTHTTQYRTNRFWRLARHIIIVENRLSLTYSNVHSISWNNERKCTSRMLYISYRFRTTHMSLCNVPANASKTSFLTYCLLFIDSSLTFRESHRVTESHIKYIVTHKS